MLKDFIPDNDDAPIVCDYYSDEAYLNSEAGMMCAFSFPRR